MSKAKKSAPVAPMLSNDELHARLAELETLFKKRGPGRPKGSKNREKAPAVPAPVAPVAPAPAPVVTTLPAPITIEYTDVRTGKQVEAILEFKVGASGRIYCCLNTGGYLNFQDWHLVALAGIFETFGASKLRDVGRMMQRFNLELRK